MSPKTIGGRGVRRIYHREGAIFEVLFRLLELTIDDCISRRAHRERREKIMSVVKEIKKPPYSTGLYRVERTGVRGGD